MSGKPVVASASACRDVEEAGEKTALLFIDALERVYRHLSRTPSSGSPRYAYELDLPGLRCWPFKRFPYLVFYVEGETQIDVWRVLQAERDIPAWLRSGDEPEGQRK